MTEDVFLRAPKRRGDWWRRLLSRWRRAPSRPGPDGPLARRQRRAKRVMLAGAICCGLLALSPAVAQLAEHGWSAFVFRGPGVGATPDGGDAAPAPHRTATTGRHRGAPSHATPAAPAARTATAGATPARSSAVGAATVTPAAAGSSAGAAVLPFLSVSDQPPHRPRPPPPPCPGGPAGGVG